MYPEGLPLNCARHIFVSDFYTTLMPRLPASATRLSLHAFNPMPPEESSTRRMWTLPLWGRGMAGASQGVASATATTLGGFAGWLVESVRGLIGGDNEGDEGHADGNND